MTTPALTGVSINSNGKHLSTFEAVGLAIVVVLMVIAIGILVVYARRGRLRPKSAQDNAAMDKVTGASSGQPQGSTSVVRAWLALALVAGLLLFCVAAFALDDEQLRSTLVGGLVAAASSATGFYFSSSSADKAREDVLNALGNNVTVPDLSTKSVADARTALAALSLLLVVHPLDATDGTVGSQQPAPGATVNPGTAVHVDVPTT